MIHSQSNNHAEDRNLDAGQNQTELKGVQYHAPQVHIVGKLEKLQANGTGAYFDGPAEYLFDGF